MEIRMALGKLGRRGGFGSLGGLGRAGTTTPEVIGGITIGDAGTGIRSGFKLTWGDDFNTRPTTWSGANTSGKYSSSPPHVGFRRESAASADVAIYIEPGYRGARSTSPTDLGFDAASVASSILSVAIQPIPVGLSAFLPTSYTQGGGDGSNKPQLISTALRSWPTFTYSASGDFILEVKARLPAGVASGFWAGFWGTAFNWPDYGEVDIFETLKSSLASAVGSTAVLHVSDTDAGADVGTALASAGSISTSVFTTFMIKKAGTTLTVYDDVAVTGTMALKGTYTNARVGRLRGAHDVRIDNMVNPNWDGSTFSAADWPKTVEYDWIRVWCPSASAANAAMNVLSSVNTTAGGSWASVIPSDSSLFGGTSPDLVEVYGAFDNEDTPGMPTRANRLPGGMTVDMTGRTTSGTVPSTEGGRVGLLFLGSFTAGGPARRAIRYFNVAPVALATVWADFTAAGGDVVSKTIAYTDFHSGNLGPHTYTVTKTAGGTDYTITGSGTGSVTISGTAATNETSTFSVVCTNAIGQTTTVTKTISYSAIFNPATWTSAIEWWDSTDNTTVFSDSAATTQAVSGTDKARAWIGKKLGANLANSTSTLTSPAYQADSINSKKVAKFTRANVTRLTTTDATVIAAANGNDKSHAVLMAVRRGTNAVSATPASFSRLTTQNDFMRYAFSGGDAVGCVRSINGVSTNALSANTIATTDVWNIVLFHFNGTTLDVRMNGTLIASAVACDTNALTLGQFSVGAIFTAATTAWDSSTAFDGAIGEIMILNGGISLADATLLSAESYLATKWQ